MTIDQRALDKATAALAGYIRANPPRQFHNKYTGQDDSIISDMHARACIEAYEAALWRPIEQALLEKTVLVCLPDCRNEIYMATRYEGGDWRFDTFDDELELSHDDLVERGAMFRTIEPPPQK